MAKKVSMVVAAFLIILLGLIFLIKNSGVKSLSYDEISESRDFFCEESLNETLLWGGLVPLKRIQNAELKGAILQKHLFASDRLFCFYEFQDYLISTYQGEIYSITDFYEFSNFKIDISDIYEKYGEPEYIGFLTGGDPEYIDLSDYRTKNYRSLIWEEEGVNLSVYLWREGVESEKEGCHEYKVSVSVYFVTYFDPNSDYMEFPIIIGRYLFQRSRPFFISGDNFSRDPFTAENFADSWEEEICE